MEIADNLGALTCARKSDVESDVKTASDEEDIIEPDIDVGTYDDIVDDSENNNYPNINKIKTNIPLFTGFLIDQLIGKQ